MLEMAARFRKLLEGATQVDITRLDRQFIRLLLELSRNPLLGQIIPLYSLSSRFWHAYQYLYTNRYRHGTLTHFHIAIAEAVAVGDEAATRAQVEVFMDYVEVFTVYVGKELSDQDPSR